MDYNMIEFDIGLGRKKPVNIHHENNACPFCDKSQLSGIIDTDGDIIFLPNKYNVLSDADQFVLIEGADCDSDIPYYSKSHLHRLIRFGVKHWFRLMESKKYSSVIFFKNFGPMSGGTIRHPHMQIIGFKNVNPDYFYNADEFSGLVIDSCNGVEFNIATSPKIGFYEFNIVPKNNETLDTVADYIQIATDYIMNHFGHCKSYNVFFYTQEVEEQKLIRARVIPRYSAPPLFVGYNIHVKPSNLEEVVNKIQTLYFKK